MNKIKNMIDIIEQDEKLLQYEYNDILIWPIIRYYVIQKVIDNLQNLNNPKSGKSETNYFLDFKNILYSFFKNPFLFKKKEAIFFNSNISNVKHINGFYYNRICDYLDKQLNLDSSMIEEPTGFFHLTPKLNKNIYSKLPIIFLVEFKYRIKNIFSKDKHHISKQLDNLFIDLNLLLNHYSHNFDLFTIYEEIKPSLQKLIFKSPIYYKFYKSFIKKKCTKYLFIEDAHYGLDKALLIKASRELGIIVIEPQHGFVGFNHPAYSFGEGVRKNKDFQIYYPNYFFSYGKFWNNSISIPNKSFIIGNPHLANYCIRKTTKISSNKILIISSGISLEETTLLVFKILELSKNYIIYLRPHPQELPYISTKFKDLISSGIIIDYDDLYTSLSNSDIIISELSTVLFESIYLKLNVFLFNTNYTKSIFVKEILYCNIIDLNSINIIFKKFEFNENAINYYWSSNWKENFNSFIKYCN